MSNTFLRTLEHKYSDEEIDNMNAALIDDIYEKDELEQKKSAANSEYNAKIKKLDSSILTLAKDIRRGAIDEDIECRLEKDLEKDIARIIRNDTQEVIEERPLTDQERQLEIQATTPDNGEIVTNDNYWDCECKNDGRYNYIHPKEETKCPECGALAEDSADSRQEEVELFLIGKGEVPDGYELRCPECDGDSIIVAEEDGVLKGTCGNKKCGYKDMFKCFCIRENIPPENIEPVAEEQETPEPEEEKEPAETE